jgi:predicted  nucleic acid-binding Zn-ribbon protein
LNDGGFVHPDVAALLELQTDDAEIYTIERGMADLTPRLEALAAARDRELAAVAKARQDLDLEERRYRELQTRIAQHRQLHERHQAQLDTISNARQATAAMAQLDQARRMVADVERELDVMSRRVSELRRALEDRERAAQALEQEQQSARATLDADRGALEARLKDAQGRRESRAQRVPRSLLSRYDRIRTRKREHTLVPLRGVSCSHCDTMIPMQRRTAMAGTGAVEICEGCGVLLYAPE